MRTKKQEMESLIVFGALAYGLSWLIWLPLYAESLGLRPLPVLPYHHAWGGLGPMLASFIMTWYERRKMGIYSLLRSSVQIRPVGYFLIALCSPFLLAVLAAVLNFFWTNHPLDLSGILSCKEFPWMNLPQFFIYNLVFFGWGEEIGWRGFALPRLQSRWKSFKSSAILTVLWAIWHWPLFLYRPGYATMELSGIIGWVLSLFTGSILLTWLYNSSRGSILICAVFHATIDIAFTAEYADKNIVNMMGFLITVWGIVTLGILTSRRYQSARID